MTVRAQIHQYRREIDDMVSTLPKIPVPNPNAIAPTTPGKEEFAPEIRAKMTELIRLCASIPYQEVSDAELQAFFLKKGLDEDFQKEDSHQFCDYMLGAAVMRYFAKPQYSGIIDFDSSEVGRFGKNYSKLLVK